MDSVLTVHGKTVAISPIVSLARSAGDLIQKIYNEEALWDIQLKSDSSPLTRADTAANEHICKVLCGLHPEIPIMSEENESVPYEERCKWLLYWCVDPLDGTKEFVKRNGEFTVNIALMAACDEEHPEKGAEPVLGVVHAPVLQRSYFASRGNGAWIMEDGENENVAKMSCKEFDESDKGLTIVCSRSHLDEVTNKFMEKFLEPVTKSMGSSLKFMLIANGDAHVYPRMAPTMEWDTAASQIVVEEAGGCVLDAESLLRMSYNKEELRNSFFVVYGTRKTNVYTPNGLI